MDKRNRKELRSDIGKTDDLRKRIYDVKVTVQMIADDLDELKGSVEFLKDEEEMHHDNLPDNFQFGEQGEKMQEIVNSLENALYDLDSAAENLNEALETAEN